MRVRKTTMLVHGLMAIAVAPLCGCGDSLPERVPVSGIVTIDGQPLTLGQVTMAPANERASIGAIGPDGRFTLTCYKLADGVVPGTHPISVTAAEQIDEFTVRWLAPKKYQDLKSSGLSATVDKPTADLKIELTWDGAKPFIEKSR
jgi:hypothetical protein